ncbi:hypothetical protein ACFQY5_25525 [Paeniroseomonas aquatica]|uniref:hypothetical protein n=1 Tax=Paeniroseomonas aquatica TaxID=373043 RepID=UPI0036232EF1
MSALRRILRDPVATLGLLLVLFAALVAIFAPWLAPYPDDAFDSHLLQRLKPPSAEFPSAPTISAATSSPASSSAPAAPSPSPSRWSASPC